jgi:phage shock protein A
MNDDIVTRLRRSTWRDCIEAADEIERMRRNTGCARNQGTTQFCHEALDAQRDVETLKAELVRNADECRETLTELRQRVETLTAERDEIRLSYCSLMEAYRGGDGRVTANKLGWGYLFAEDSK